MVEISDDLAKILRNSFAVFENAQTFKTPFTFLAFIALVVSLTMCFLLCKDKKLKEASKKEKKSVYALFVGIPFLILVVLLIFHFYVKNTSEQRLFRMISVKVQNSRLSSKDLEVVLKLFQDGIIVTENNELRYNDKAVEEMVKPIREIRKQNKREQKNKQVEQSTTKITESALMQEKREEVSEIERLLEETRKHEQQGCERQTSK